MRCSFRPLGLVAFLAALFVVLLSWDSLSSAPAGSQKRPAPSAVFSAQRASRRVQDAFCRDLASQYSGSGAPANIELAWSATRPGELEMRPLRTNDSTQVGDSLGLLRVDGILSPGSHADGQPDVRPGNLSMYVFAARHGASDVVSQFLLDKKAWEAPEITTIIRHLDSTAKALKLPRHDVYLVDIGANVGAFTLAAAAAGYSVIAVEAMAMNQHALRASLCANPGLAERVTLIPSAVGRDATRCALHSLVGNVLDGTVRCGDADAETVADPAYVKRQDVDIARLDDLLEDWLPRLKGRVGALKMDVEGFEPWVVEGGREFFRVARPLFMMVELSTMTTRATGVTPHELLERLAAPGYEIRLGTVAASAVSLADAVIPARGEINGFLALPETSFQRASRALRE